MQVVKFKLNVKTFDVVYFLKTGNFCLYVMWQVNSETCTQWHCLIIIFCMTDLVSGELKDLTDKEAVTKAIRASVMSKQYGNEDFLSQLISDACSKSLSTFMIEYPDVCVAFPNYWSQFMKKFSETILSFHLIL